MSWEIKTIGEVCTIEKGNIGITKAVDGDYPLVVLGEERRTHNEFQFDDEAVIIPLVSSTGHGHRSMKRIHYQSGKFSIGSILCAVIPEDKSTLSARYLFRYLDLNKENELVSRMKGMANVSLSMKSIAEVEVPIPPIKEQYEFVSKFDALEKSTNTFSVEQSHQLNLLKKLRQQILQDAVQGKLVPPDPNDEPASKLLERIKAEKEQLIREKKIKKDKPMPEIRPEEIPFEIPENWVWSRLGILGLCKTGTTPSTSVKEYFGNDIPFIKPADISLRGIDYNNEGLSFSGLKEGVVVPKGSLLMVCIGGSIGKSYFNEVDVSCNQQINTITPLSKIRADLLQSFLQSNYFQTAIWTKASGGTTPIVNRSKWENIPISIPPLQEQHRIVTKIEQLMKLCNELEHSIQQNQKYTQELLQVALKEALEPAE